MTHIFAQVLCCRRYSAVAEVPPVASLPLPVPVQLGVHHRVHLVLHLRSDKNSAQNGRSHTVIHPSNSTQSIHSSIMILFLLPDSALKLVLLDAVCINYCERIGCIFGPAHVLRTPTIARLWSNHLHWPKPLQGLSLCYISYHLIISYHHSHSDGKYHCVIMRLSPQPWVLHRGVTLHLSHNSFSLLWV